MLQKIAKTYRLRCDDPVMDGRPCWVQKVAKAKDLYILAQARKPSEKGFPYVETLLVTVSRDGKLTEYGDRKTLGVLTDLPSAGGPSRRAIQWVDGTGVTWVESS